MLTYKPGDVFEHIKDIYEEAHVIIPHVCNNIGGWGSGFVIPLAQNFPDAEIEYRKWHKSKWNGGYGFFALGNTQDVHPSSNVVIMNMIAQNNTIGTNPGSVPIRYWALAKCMVSVKNMCDGYNNPEIHTCKFGSGLAGGNWDFIETLINEIWCDIPVTIYEL